MDQTKTLQQTLKKVSLFSSLDSKSLKIIEKKMNMVSYQNGEYLCKEGESADRMFIIISGKIRVLKKGKKSSLTEITVLEPGSVTGIMSLLERTNRSASLQAYGNVRVWELKYETFQKLLDTYPKISRSLLSLLSNYLRKETEVVANLISLDVEPRLKVAFFDTKPYIQTIFEKYNEEKYFIKFFKPRLNGNTVSLATNFKVVCAFVNDTIDSAVIQNLSKMGVELIAMRCAGYNNVDIVACKKQGISVVRVPAYSPYAVAEHTIALIMALNRHIHKANNRIREGNFSLDGLVGFDMYQKTVGVIGSGKIGKCLIDILLGFGCNILVYDKYPDKEILNMKSVEYVPLNRLLKKSDIISLHVPLTPETKYMINKKSINQMKHGVMLINTSRGGLVNTQDLITGLKEGKIGSAGLDVYEEESEYFFEDYSDTMISDDILARLTTFNNVMVTSHMAFLTNEALENITKTTLENINEYEQGKRGSQLSNAI